MRRLRCRQPPGGSSRWPLRRSPLWLLRTIASSAHFSRVLARPPPDHRDYLVKLPRRRVLLVSVFGSSPAHEGGLRVLVQRCPESRSVSLGLRRERIRRESPNRL